MGGIPGYDLAYHISRCNHTCHTPDDVSRTERLRPVSRRVMAGKPLCGERSPGSAQRNEMASTLCGSELSRLAKATARQIEASLLERASHGEGGQAARRTDLGHEGVVIAIVGIVPPREIG